MLKTTQQTVARWESGQATPSVAALRDLAVIYRTSVDDLLGKNPLSTGAATNSYFALDESDERFWGHLGLRLPGDQHTRWFPITEKQANQVDKAVSGADDNPWLVVSTLNNRMLLINMSSVEHIYMLDDNADEISDDWELGWDSYNGHSLEVYRALADIYWGDGDVERSETFLAGVHELMGEEGLTRDKLGELVVETAVYFHNGTVRRCTPEKSKLWGAVYDAEHGPVTMFDLSEPDTGLTAYFPAKLIRMIDMPLYQVIDAAKKELGVDESDATREGMGLAPKSSAVLSSEAPRSAAVVPIRTTGESTTNSNAKASGSARYFIVEGGELKVLPQKTFKELFFEHKNSLPEYAGKPVRVVSAWYSLRNRKPTEIVSIEAFDFLIDGEGGLDEDFERERTRLNSRALTGGLTAEEQARRRPQVPADIKAKIVKEILG